MIGLEVHAQVVSEAKLFSGASTTFGAEPNTQVSLVDAAMPGMLPVPNRECIRQAVRTGMALDAVINRWSRFDRKNYFYADLPQGYQISQLYHPLVGDGRGRDPARREGREFSAKQIGIERIHVEQDAGKLMHDQHPTMSYVDLNRCGVALMEIVSPARHEFARRSRGLSAQAAGDPALRRVVRRQYGRRLDARRRQRSVRKPGGELGTRTETKNVNSVRFVMAVIEHEARRQVELIEEGGAVVQETRLFDPDKGVTRTLRSKEDAHDYRYFPDPDLLPLELDEAFLDECRASLPELPDAKRKRFEGLGITRLQRQRPDRRGRDRALVRCACSTAGRSRRCRPPTGSRRSCSARSTASARRSPTARSARRRPPSCSAWSPTARSSGSLAKQVFEIMLETGEGAAAIVEARGLKQTSDTGAIDAAIDEILAANADKVEQYKAARKPCSASSSARR